MALDNGEGMTAPLVEHLSVDGGKPTLAMEEDNTDTHKMNGLVHQSNCSPPVSATNGSPRQQDEDSSPPPAVPLPAEYFMVTESLEQLGTLLLGEGHKRDRGIRTKLMGFDLPTLRREQHNTVNKAKRFAMERSISMVLMRQTIAQQQQQALGLQQHQALVLMCRVYVGSISFELRENSVRQAFVPFGVIKSIDMSWDNIAMKHKGFAFIEYDTPEAAQLAEDQMNNVVLGGRNIKVGRPSNMPQAQIIIEQIREEAKGYNRIYVASIHHDLTLPDVRSVFEAFGSIVHCHMPMSTITGRHNGYCYIEYATTQATVEAVASMNLFDLGGQFLRVGRCCSPARALEILNGALPPTTGRSDPMPAAASLAVATASARLQRTSGTAAAVLGRASSGLLPLPPAVQLAPPPPPSVINVTQLGAPLAIPPPGVVIPVLGQPVAPVTPAAVSLHVTPPVPAVSVPPPPAVTVTASQAPTASNGAVTSSNNESGGERESRVLLLRNMVGVEDVDESLQHEISEECERYGSVRRVLIYQEAQGEHAGADVVVKVFVEFEQAHETEQARAALHGRFFGGRQVQAQLYNWKLYENNELSA